MSSAYNPLAAPHDDLLLRRYLEFFQLPFGGDRRQLLIAVAQRFATLPYENLTKIIRHADATNSFDVWRGPEVVVGDHMRWGTGGTCFSLTAALLHLVRALGFRAEPILADRRYGANTHCALLVWLDDHPHLLDPGYLITTPIPLDPNREQRLDTSFNQVRLVPQTTPGRIDLLTAVPVANDARTTYRLTFKTDPVDAGEFLRVWDDSFAWEMMSYPVITQVRDGSQHYLQGHRLQIRTRHDVQRRELSTEQLGLQVVHEFGIAPEIVRRALELLGNDLGHRPRRSPSE